MVFERANGKQVAIQQIPALLGYSGPVEAMTNPDATQVITRDDLRGHFRATQAVVQRVLDCRKDK